MKWIIYLFVLVICSVSLGSTTPNINRQAQDYIVGAEVQQSMKLIRTMTADDTNFTASNMDWRSADANGIDIPENWASLDIFIYAYGDGSGGGSPANGAAVLKFYGAPLYGPFIPIEDVNVQIGTAQLSHLPTVGTVLWGGLPDPNYCWADTITRVEHYWPQGVKMQSVPSGYVGYIHIFDRLSMKKIWVKASGMENVTSITVVMTGGY
jgi:hypothetical protein